MSGELQVDPSSVFLGCVMCSKRGKFRSVGLTDCLGITHSRRVPTLWAGRVATRVSPNVGVTGP